MKNLKKVQSYWGYNVIFDNYEMMERFIDMYDNLILDSKKHIYQTEDGEWNFILHIVVEKGVIKTIKEGLGDMMRCGKNHNRYYVSTEWN